ncbi:MAG: LysM peptidoglycan-binding domain-containing protein, partial [Limisphaerales bacterium]
PLREGVGQRYDELLKMLSADFMGCMEKCAVLTAFVFVTMLVGCAHRRGVTTSELDGRAFSRVLLSDTNAAPGSVHAVKIYVVQAGDTLTRIANRFGISVKELRGLNRELNGPRISIGQQIRVAEERVGVQGQF